MRVFWIAGTVVLLDQATKAAVVQFMYREQSIPLLGDWLRLTFTENPGMAFGITIGPPGTVTVLSLGATLLVAAYIYQVRNEYAPYRWSLSLILGGALGNIIDRVFYGVLLDYGTWFTGRVVDFIHVSLWQGFIPRSVPFLGGSYLELFPIWNVADMSIVLGVVGVMVFHHTFHVRQQARRRRRRAAALSRVVRTRKVPSAMFTDLGKEIGSPPAVPSALPKTERPTSRDGVAGAGGNESELVSPSVVREEPEDALDRSP
ncbi:MAG: signal peptidase II [Salinibacter sp.]